MAHGYKPVDRDQLFLLPPDMREWLPASHLVWFVLEVVDKVDTSALHERHPRGGPGRQAYDPDMLLALLVYGYCTGQRSSRRIERLCEVDVAYRVVCANLVPDHSTVARFRSANEDVVGQLFTDVLVLCAAAGLAKVGVVAVDGTKIAAPAAKSANRTRAQLERAVQEMLAEAAATDAAEDERHGAARGDELPVELADPARRRARLEAALAALAEKEAARAAAEAEAAARHEEEGGKKPTPADPLAAAEADLVVAVAQQKARTAAWQAARDAARRAGEPEPPRPHRQRATRVRRRIARLQAAPPPAPSPAAAPKELRVNVTDTESALMKLQGGGWLQGYNAQAAVNEAGIVLATGLSAEVVDFGQCRPMLAALARSLAAAGISEPVGVALFDAGYLSVANLTAPGPDRLIATAKRRKLAQRRAEVGPAEGPPPAGAGPVAAMEHRLRTAEGAALYAKRSPTVEPGFGYVKENLGYRRFMRRGLAACRSEWSLICTASNLNKLFRAQTPALGSG